MTTSKYLRGIIYTAAVHEAGPKRGHSVTHPPILQSPTHRNHLNMPGNTMKSVTVRKVFENSDIQQVPIPYVSPETFFISLRIIDAELFSATANPATTKSSSKSCALRPIQRTGNLSNGQATNTTPAMTLLVLWRRSARTSTSQSPAAPSPPANIRIHC